jgi:plasmid maintenance system antidote protein VapI
MYLTPKQLSINSRIPLAEILDIIDGSQEITPEIATKLSDALGTSRYYWKALQIRFDMERASQQTTAPDRPKSFAEEITTGVHH